MTEKKSNLLPILGVGAVVVAGGVGAYFFLSKSPTPLGGGVSSTAGTMTVVPKQALMSVSISTDGAALSKLEQFLSPETKKLYDEALSQFRSGLSSGDVDYEKDVKPWIGKSVSIAILPQTKTASLKPAKLSSALIPRYVPMSDTGSIQFVQAPAAAEAPPNYLMVLEVKDKAGAEKFFAEKVKAKANGKEKQSDYKGVKITEYGEGATATSSAMVGDYLVISSQPQTAQKAIDTFQGEASLASVSAADDLKLQNPVAQVYFPAFGQSITELQALNPDSREEIPPELLKELQKVKSIHMGFGIDDAGIRFKALGKFDPSAIAALKNSPNKILSQIPAQAFSLVTGANIKGSWEQFVKSAENTPEAKQAIESARAQAKSSPLAIDLDKDVFGWMDGEFALASISAKPEGILVQTQGLAPLLLLQTSNRAAGESLLKKLDGFISQNGGQVATKDVGGVAVTEWTAPGAGAVVSHGWGQQDTMFITVSPIVSLFIPKPASAIDADATFKSIVSTLPSNNVGYFYVDVDRTWNVIQTFIPPAEKESIPAEAKALIQSIRGLAITGAYPNQETAEFEALLALKKGGK